MKSPDSPSEPERLKEEYRRRAAEISDERYAPWHPAESLMREERRRLAAAMLRHAGRFPGPETPCLEIGYGRLGWLGDLVAWGVESGSLAGIELDEERAAMARRVLPDADLRIGDAVELPWDDGSFGLVIASTVFTSVLDADYRRAMAAEATRVLRRDGALLWYDFRVDNPRNRAVRGIGRRELRELFPALLGRVRSLTLAPPLARLVTPRSHLLATALSALPFLRTHLLGVIGFARESVKRRDLSDIAGTWVEDPTLDEALADQRRVDPELWR